MNWDPKLVQHHVKVSVDTLMLWINKCPHNARRKEWIKDNCHDVETHGNKISFTFHGVPFEYIDYVDGDDWKIVCTHVPFKG